MHFQDKKLEISKIIITCKKAFAEVYHGTNKGLFLATFRKRVTQVHPAVKGNKTSEEFLLHQLLVKQTVNRLRKLKSTISFPKSGRKITPQGSSVRSRIHPGGTSKQLQISLILINVNVNESPIRKTLNNNAWQGCKQKASILQKVAKLLPIDSVLNIKTFLQEEIQIVV